ncbi:MAG: hypothetical protein AAF797_16025 [Planctomycetota bacterium]
MSVELREIRTDELDDALRFMGEHGGITSPTQARHDLSLLARDGDGKTLGAAVLHRVAETAAVLQVALAEALADDDACRLIDKALLKAQTGRLRRVRIMVLDGERQQRLWEAQDFLKHGVQGDAA